MEFENFKVNKNLLKGLRNQGLEVATEIQEKTFSPIMSGANVLGVAPTGTGKTIAYLLPLLNMWRFSKERYAQFLIITPTRELVQQVVEEIEKLTPTLNVVTVGVYGEVNIKNHEFQVSQGLDILVGTPGRIFDLILKGSFNQKKIIKVVIDEIDIMLDLGFRPQLTRILDALPPRRQNLLFSATLSKSVEELIVEYFDDPIYIKASIPNNRLENITQGYYFVQNFYTKVNLFQILLRDEKYKKVLVFVSTKKKADLVYDLLTGFLQENILIIHANKSQNKRFAALNAFKEGEGRILIATDLMSRGIDIDEVSHVVNFDLPDTPEQYIHRIGRTGRNELEGTAISLIKESEIENQANIEKYMKYAIPQLELPENLIVSENLIEEEQTKYRW